MTVEAEAPARIHTGLRNAVVAEPMSPGDITTATRPLEVPVQTWNSADRTQFETTMSQLEGSLGISTPASPPRGETTVPIVRAKGTALLIKQTPIPTESTKKPRGRLARFFSRLRKPAVIGEPLKKYSKPAVGTVPKEKRLDVPGRGLT